ncbi:MAG TPA: hypothetical protein VHO25_02015, partial [Polyangiaceae bacterium]|nr:hypothetical protein [Polyangiaceae bacterium]
GLTAPRGQAYRSRMDGFDFWGPFALVLMIVFGVGSACGVMALVVVLPVSVVLAVLLKSWLPLWLGLAATGGILCKRLFNDPCPKCRLGRLIENNYSEENENTEGMWSSDMPFMMQNVHERSCDLCSYSSRVMGDIH